MSDQWGRYNPFEAFGLNAAGGASWFDPPWQPNALGTTTPQQPSRLARALSSYMTGLPELSPRPPGPMPVPSFNDYQPHWHDTHRQENATPFTQPERTAMPDIYAGGSFRQGGAQAGSMLTNMLAPALTTMHLGQFSGGASYDPFAHRPNMQARASYNDGPLSLSGTYDPFLGPKTLGVRAGLNFRF